MARYIVLDEFYLSFRVPRGQPDAESLAAKQVLDDPGFHAELRRAVREVLKQFGALAAVRVVVVR